MKISVQQYAQSLYDSVIDKSDKEIKSALKNFVMILGRNRDLNKANEIIERLIEIWDKENQELAAELISARDLNTTTKEIVINYLKQRTKSQKINLAKKLDKDLLGGFILRYDSKVVDGSLKNSLEELRKEIRG